MPFKTYRTMQEVTQTSRLQKTPGQVTFHHQAMKSGVIWEEKAQSE